MSDLEIVSNPLRFRDAFLSQVPLSRVDDDYQSQIRILLYYVWRGANASRTSLLQNKVQSDLGFLSLSIYQAFLPVLQTIRLGYPTDAFILLRALLERIALLGYLHNNRDLLPKYVEGKTTLQDKAMSWAKQHAPENWMRLYSELSKIAHSRIQGVAGHLLGNNPISVSFRSTLHHPSPEGSVLIDELLAGTFYSLIAADTFATEILDRKGFTVFPKDARITLYVSPEDLQMLQAFLKRLIDKYQKPKKG